MIPLSRTARISDDIHFGVSEIIEKYAASPKDFNSKSNPRYKFWDYALACRIIEENKISSVLDIGLTQDTVFKTILGWYDIELKEVDYLSLDKLPVRENKYPLVTCFGIMEHVELKRAFLQKLLKHVEINGFLLVTTDNESANKNKKRLITFQDLLDFSYSAEKIGYELYDLDKDLVVDYIINNKNELNSLVLRRVGR